MSYGDDNKYNDNKRNNQDDNPRKLFVGGLSWDTTDDSLTKEFQKFGEVESAKVVTDRETGRSRGFAFVEMQDKEAADAAIEGLHNTEFEGRQINVSVAKKPTGDRKPPRFGDNKRSGGFGDNKRSGGGFGGDKRSGGGYGGR